MLHQTQYKQDPTLRTGAKKTNQCNGSIIFGAIVLKHNSMSFHVSKIFLCFFACAGTQT